MQLDKKHFIILFLFSVVIYTAIIFRVKSILWGDSLYYYAYTKSIVLDHDIDFTNEAFRETDGFPNTPEISEITGKVINKFSPGSSIMWMPGFVLGRLLGDTTGYNFFTQYIVAISAIGFSVLGIFYVYKTLLLMFDRHIASITTIFIFLTTQMFFYTVIDPLNSHSASFMLSSLFLYLVALFMKEAKFKENFSWQRMLVLGLVGGVIMLVRNQDVVVILPAALYFILKKSDGLMEMTNKAILFWGSVFLIMSIQLFFTLDLYGRLGSPYLIAGEQISWFNPDFFRVLFSFENGLFTFAPVLMISVIGIIWSFNSSIKNHYYKNIKQSTIGFLSLIALFGFALQLYVVASWGREIIGGPYGSRMFVSVLPYLSLGLAFFLDKFKKIKIFYQITFLVLGLLFVNNLAQTAIMLVRF